MQAGRINIVEDLQVAMQDSACPVQKGLVKR